MSGYIGSKASVVSSGAERKKTYSITGTTTSLTGASYTPNQVHVFHNGVRLVDGTDYTATDGSTVTLTTAAENGDEVVVISYATFQTSDTVSASAGGTFSNAVTIDADGATVLTVDRATSDGTIIDVQRGGTSTAVIGVSAGDDVYFAGATGSSKGIYFNANGLLPATTGGSASDGTVDIGEGITRWKDLYLSGGVYLGGTGSANKLDDYEEGTWTPTYTQSTTAPTVTYLDQTGFYRKIGSLVFVSGRLNTDAVSGGSGQVQIAGLPFTIASLSADNSTFNVGVSFATWNSNAVIASGYGLNGQTKIATRTFNGSDPRGGLDTQVTSLYGSTNGNGLVFSMCYITS